MAAKLGMTAPGLAARRTSSSRPWVWTSQRVWLLYAVAALLWLITRGLVLVHQGAWPWMNAFVVYSAQGFATGDWTEAVRPPLPGFIALPFVIAGLSEDQVIAVLYLVASSLQLVGFVFAIREVFPRQYVAQALALLIFVTVPLNHSIHHYRDVPVVLATAGTFLLVGHWCRYGRREGKGTWTLGSIVWVLGAALLAVWSRTETLTFVGVVILAGIVLVRKAALRTAPLYLLAFGLAVLGLQIMGDASGAPPNQALQYQVHTFLDSTPASWLSPECRANPSENCRDADGTVIFAPFDRNAGVIPLVLSHPWLATVKTVESAVQNVELLYVDDLSTFPGIVPFVILAALLVAECRAALRAIPRVAWVGVIAAVGITILPPLSWAPPHPQYHLHGMLAIAIVLPPVLLALCKVPRAQWSVWAFYATNIALSAWRYTRYAGY